jgi:septum formation protein
VKHNRQFILASASPRRKLLLEKAGYRFDVIPSDVDESSFDMEGVSSVEHTRQLALAKACDIASRFPDRIVFGADTVVEFAGTIIGKPTDAADAEQITRTLFSAPHEVITGIALVGITDSIRIVEADTTVVYPKKLTDEQIARHIESGDWQGKAGAYGIQESGDEFVEKIDGSFTNVMGLPMELVTEVLDSLGIRPHKS